MSNPIPPLDLTHLFLLGNYNHLFLFGYGLVVFDPFEDMVFFQTLD